MNNNYNLLFLCAHYDNINTQIKEETINTIAGITDWSEFLDIVHLHGMTALLYMLLKELDLLNNIPVSVSNRLHRFFILNAARNERLQKLLFDIINIFNNAGIDIVPIKGIVLAQELYDDIAYRTMEDLDFIVSPQDMINARELLLTSGFEDHINLLPDDIPDYIKMGYDFLLRHRESGLLIEVGCGISLCYMGFHVLQDSMFKARHTVELSSGTVQTLIPEIQFILLCIHDAKHHWCRIIWLNDIVTLLNKYPDMDFDKIKQYAQSIGAWRIVQVTLNITKIIYNIEVPETVWCEIDKNSRKQAEKIAEGIRRLDKLSSWQYRWQYILMLDSMRMRIKYIFLLLFTPNKHDWQTVNLSPRWRFIYYIIRPVRILFKKRYS